MLNVKDGILRSRDNEPDQPRPTTFVYGHDFKESRLVKNLILFFSSSFIKIKLQILPLLFYEKMLVFINMTHKNI